MPGNALALRFVEDAAQLALELGQLLAEGADPVGAGLRGLASGHRSP